MLAECLQDLFTRVVAVEGLTADDVTVMYAGSAPVQMNAVQTLPITKRKALFSVQIALPYTGQEDYMENQAPVLEALVKAIHGQMSPANDRWKDEGDRLYAIDEASKSGEQTLLRYETRFSTTMTP